MPPFASLRIPAGAGPEEVGRGSAPPAACAWIRLNVKVPGLQPLSTQPAFDHLAEDAGLLSERAVSEFQRSPPQTALILVQTPQNDAGTLLVTKRVGGFRNF